MKEPNQNSPLYKQRAMRTAPRMDEPPNVSIVAELLVALVGAAAEPEPEPEAPADPEAAEALADPDWLA